MNSFYRVKKPKMAWGDYGSILHHGMAGHLGRTPDETIQLERTAPYVPEITFPSARGEIVVANTFREKLESGPFQGLSFKPVIKARIVPSDWHTWDQTASKPKRYPRGGGPEGYILDRKHSPELAEQIGDLWELILPMGAEAVRVEGEKPWIVTYFLRPETWKGMHWFRAGKVLSYVTDTGKAWLDEHAPGLLQFEPARIKED